jgi:predicted transport protein
MADVKVKVKGDEIVITMPFNKKGKPSGSGKSNVHASTNGNVEVEAEGFDKPLKVGINIYTPKD